QGQRLLVEVGGVPAERGGRDVRCPVAGAARDLEDAAAREEGRHPPAQFRQRRLPGGDLVHALVLGGAPRVVARHLLGHDARARATVWAARTSASVDATPSTAGSARRMTSSITPS